MKEIIVAPSILSVDYSQTDNQLEELMKSNAKWLHFDVMDGHFVPNLTFGPDILKGFKKKTGLFMDVHIMVSNPDFVSDIFIAKGADMITFHYEAMDDIGACIELCKKIQAKDCKCGITVKPGTSVEVLEPILSMIDLVLIMSVEPGFGGQAFIDTSLNKIKYLSDFAQLHNLNYDIEVDGGINAETAKLCIDSGANVLVAGSYVFNGDIIEQVQTLLCLK